MGFGLITFSPHHIHTQYVFVQNDVLTESRRRNPPRTADRLKFADMVWEILFGATGDGGAAP
jgi:hypothetical protein